jgi:aspartate carbamoyltransferase catalytic subunit
MGLQCFQKLSDMKNNHFFNRDIVSIKDFSKDDLEFVFDATDKIRTLALLEFWDMYSTNQVQEPE